MAIKFHEMLTLVSMNSIYLMNPFTILKIVHIAIVSVYKDTQLSNVCYSALCPINFQQFLKHPCFFQPVTYYFWQFSPAVLTPLQKDRRADNLACSAD